MLIFDRPLAAELLADDPDVLEDPDTRAVAVLGWGRVNGDPHFLVVDRFGRTREVVTPDVRIIDPRIQEAAAAAAEQIRAELAVPA